MKTLFRPHKDHLGAAMLVAIGTGVLIVGNGYSFGNLVRMGPGFIPVLLGGLLVAVGAAIALTTRPKSPPMAPPSGSGIHGHSSASPDWRGWACIVGGVIAFVVLGEYGGMVPATFASVLVSAIGDRQNTLKSSAFLATGITVFGAIVFHTLLKVQLPLFTWG